MVRIPIAAILTLAVAAGARADPPPGEAPPGPPPAAKPPSPTLSDRAVGVADAVLAAIRNGDDAALRGIAVSDDFDAWLVVDELLARGEREAAERLASSDASPETVALKAHVAARGRTPPSARARATVAAANRLFRTSEYAAASALLDEIVPTSPPPPDAAATLDPVTWIRALHSRGIAEREQGRRKESRDWFAAAADAALALGWFVRASASSYFEDQVALQDSDYRGSFRARARRSVVAERRGRKTSIVSTLVDLGVAHRRLGEFRKALEVHRRALVLAEEVGDPTLLRKALGELGSDHAALGDYPKGLEFQLRAFALAEASDRPSDLSWALGNLGSAYFDVSDFRRALDAYERALAIEEERRDDVAAASVLENIGLVHNAMGDSTLALQLVQRALRVFEARKDVARQAKALGNLGVVHGARGAYAEALRHYEAALEIQERIGDVPTAVTTLGNIAVLHFDLGDYDRAVAVHREALARMEAIGDAAGVVRTLGNIGAVENVRGNLTEAIAVFEKTVAACEPLGDRAMLVSQLTNLGAAVGKSGDFARAIGHLEEARRVAAEIGDGGALVVIEAHLGRNRYRAGERGAGLAILEKAASEARRLRRGTDLVAGCAALAAAWLDESTQAGATDGAGEPPLAAREAISRALAAAVEGLRAAQALLGGLGDDDGVAFRAHLVDVFQLGALAAMRARDLALTVEFLESGRAGALLDALGGRRALRWADLPPALRDAEAAAKAAERRARAEYAAAAGATDLATRRAKAHALDRAEEASRAIAGRIQREAKRQAGLHYPRPATLDEIRATLGPAAALVLYSHWTYVSAAVVVTRDGTRIVPLADMEAVAKAVDAAAGASREATDASADAALASLRERLVDPLALPASVRTVLVSPEGALCRVPWGAIFPGRDVAATPSGSTSVLLASEARAPGVGVLALGDPVYDEPPAPGAEPARGGPSVTWRGRRLVRLPATGHEAQAVGDVPLLGLDATEERLLATLRRPPGPSTRWRAVHFACHGIADPERPLRSSLALTRSGDDDGFLTVPEILRMEIPADLAVLSACETAVGKVVTGEGIVGLTRAFMYAGAPRVVCSLWKVDDEATSALMRKFYELWNPRSAAGAAGKAKPGLPAAEALRKAQEFVRSHERWKHPYYWAAWVLWGLPE